MQIQTLFIGLFIFVFALWAQFGAYSTAIGWKYRKPINMLSTVLLLVATSVFLWEAFSAASLLFALATVYSVINQMRIIYQRMNDSYLRSACSRSFYWLATLQLACVALWLLFYILPTVVAGRSAIILASIIFAIGAAVVVLTTIKNIRASQAGIVGGLAFNSLPTVTLAIPARNENTYLEQCLQAAVASSYQKLEIIVYDDCSQDHTAEIVKGFAHDGVRFVQGENLQHEWLAKNLAYQTLLDEAAGELIIFMGVDVILEPQTITNVVELFVSKKVNMMGLMPRRTRAGLVASVIQPMRYWNELALPKFIIKHEPVLSSFWVARRSALQKSGAFASVRRAIVPEEHLSTLFAKNNGGYAFVRSGKTIGLSSSKSLKNQWNTALRIGYPQAHKRPEYVLLRVVVQLFFLIAPFVVLPLLVVSGLSIVSIALCFFAVACLVASSVAVAIVTNPSTAVLALFSFPFVVVADFIAIHISMFRYEFGEVVWKGRDVAPTSMHVIPHLPKI